MTINFRIINKVIINDVYLMHCIDDQLKSIIGSKVFITLSLTKDYHQIKLHEDSKKLQLFLQLKDGKLLKHYEIKCFS